jgi:citrate synthase
MTNGAGMENAVAAHTRLSHVDGLAGELIIAGFPLEELAPNATYEQALYLLWNGNLPDDAALKAFEHELKSYRPLPDVTRHVMQEAAKANLPTMDALRMGVSTLSVADPAPEDNSEAANRRRATQLVAQATMIVGNYWRLKQGQEFLDARDDLSQAGLFLYLIHGKDPDPEFVRALDTYWVTILDHGLNASTFTARVIASTLSDMFSAITGAVGALKGPLHGGAPGPALDMVFEIGQPENAEAYLRNALDQGERLMGFGHRVYKVRDPRADVLAHASERLFEKAGDRSLYELALAVEETAIRLLEEYKPGRNLQTNVEFYTALVLHGIGLESEIFSSVFAAGRIGGWTAHVLEQLENNRLIRPKSEYVGEVGRTWPK